MIKTRTPKPWFWKHLGAEITPRLALCSPVRGTTKVMDFVRQGMQGAQPRFNDGHIMIPASELDLTQHPDACAIAAAPELLEALQGLQAAAADLLAMLKANKIVILDSDVENAMRQAAVAIELATPKPKDAKE